MASELSSTVSLDRRDGIALLWCDNPPVNAISQSVRTGLSEGIRQIAADDRIAAAIIICRGRTFFSGADITEFGRPAVHPTWSETDEAIDLSSKPIIAAIHGNCFGGGFEYALACQFRIASAGTRFGFPEVKLGLIPGGGGTQRFPRVSGFEAALDLIPSGRTMGAEEALRLGAIDRIAGGELEADAVAFAKELLISWKGRPLPRARERIAEAGGKADIFSQARENARKRQRGRAAPLCAIDAIENASRMGFEAGMAAESEIFKGCQESAEHRALAHLFFAEREARRIPGLAAELSPRRIETVAIVGGGTMGRGIALAFADAGLPVRLIEVTEEASRKAIGQIREETELAAAKGRLTSVQARERMDRILGASELSAAIGAELVIEAVFEDPGLKKRVFADLDKIMPAGAILATNTSGLDIDEIARATRRPAEVIGLHFFSPANIMKLLEIVRGEKTGADVLATALSLARRIDKQPVVARVCDGFIVNRAFTPYWRETRFLVEEGASPYDVDRALVDFGMPMGPFAVSDLVGLDVSKLIRAHRRKTLPPAARFDTIEDELANAGRLGRKNGLGWYQYAPDARAGTPDPQVLAMVDRYRRDKGFVARNISAEEIVERCIYGVINEGAKELEEGIAIRASDIDVAAVHGYGFPGHRGGPMHFGGEIGLTRVAAAIEAFHGRHGYWWQPSRLLLDLAKTGRDFSDR